MKKWFEKEMEKHNITLYYESVFCYATALASQMMRFSKVVLDSKQCFELDWKEFFHPDVVIEKYFYNELLQGSRIEFRIVKNFLPLQESNKQYKFFHKSVQEYCAACGIKNEVKRILDTKMV